MIKVTRKEQQMINRLRRELLILEWCVSPAESAVMDRLIRRGIVERGEADGGLPFWQLSVPQNSL